MKFIKTLSIAFASFFLLGIQFVSSQPFAFLAKNTLTDTLKTDTTLFINNEVTPRLISNQFNLTKGPAVDREGNIYFTYQQDNEIWKYSVKGELSIFKKNAGRPAGMTFDGEGNLITCTAQNNRLWSINPKGKVTILVKDFNGQALNGPNDVWVNKNGNIYFTDPYYPLSFPNNKKLTSDTTKQRLFLLPKQGISQLAVVDDSLTKPNGVTGTAGGKTLYVTDIEANKTFQYDITPGGKVGQ